MRYLGATQTNMNTDGGASIEVNDRRGGSSSVAFLGDWNTLHVKQDAFRRQLEDRHYTSKSEIKNILLDVAKQTVDGTVLTGEEEKYYPLTGMKRKHPMLFASFTCERGLRLSRINV